MGTYEGKFVIPNLNAAEHGKPARQFGGVEQSAGGHEVRGRRRHLRSSKGQNSDPLIQDGQKLVPNIRKVFRTDQNLYVYMEVYDPAPDAERGGCADVLSRTREGLHFGAGSADADDVGPAGRDAGAFPDSAVGAGSRQVHLPGEHHRRESRPVCLPADGLMVVRAAPPQRRRSRRMRPPSLRRTNEEAGRNRAAPQYIEQYVRNYLLLLVLAAIASAQSSPGREVGSGAVTIGKGAANGAADIGKGTAGALGTLATGHPISAATSLGHGAAKAGTHVAVGTGKGAGKLPAAPAPDLRN